MMERKFRVVIFGATGFTGELVARYFAEKVSCTDMAWAIAGRSEEKLLALRTRLADIQPACADLDVLVADTSSPETLREMTSSTAVLLTTVGPYAKYGEPVVAACVETGTDYVDITGEPSFWFDLLERHHEAAKEAGVILVPCSGFESVPPDLGALFTLQQMPASEPKTLHAYVLADGQISGGTWHSAVHAMAGMGAFNAAQRKRAKPTTLGSGEGAATPKRVRGFHRSAHAGTWALPMPTIDSTVVKRSARLRGDYGPDFQFGYFMGLKNIVQAGALMAGVGGVYALAQFPPSRSWLLSLRKPGAGPAEEVRAKGWFRLLFHGSSPSGEVLTEVRGGEPGYSETAKILSESALCLALDREKIPGKGGLLTPASAFGDVLRARLEHAGISFERLLPDAR